MTSFLSLHDAVAETVEYPLPPTEVELMVLRNVHARTDQAHSEKVTPHVGTTRASVQHAAHVCRFLT